MTIDPTPRNIGSQKELHKRHSKPHNINLDNERRKKFDSKMLSGGIVVSLKSLIDCRNNYKAYYVVDGRRDKIKNVLEHFFNSKNHHIDFY